MTFSLMGAGLLGLGLLRKRISRKLVSTQFRLFQRAGESRPAFNFLGSLILAVRSSL